LTANLIAIQERMAYNPEDFSREEEEDVRPYSTSMIDQ
jgi:hypothetical protein